MAGGATDDALRPSMEALLEAISAYKKAAGTVKSLLPKAKGKAKAKSQSKPAE